MEDYRAVGARIARRAYRDRFRAQLGFHVSQGGKSIIDTCDLIKELFFSSLGRAVRRMNINWRADFNIEVLLWSKFYVPGSHLDDFTFVFRAMKRARDEDLMRPVLNAVHLATEHARGRLAVYSFKVDLTTMSDVASKLMDTHLPREPFEIEDLKRMMEVFLGRAEVNVVAV